MILAIKLHFQNKIANLKKNFLQSNFNILISYLTKFEF